MKKDNKYGDIDELLSTEDNSGSENNSSKTTTRLKRPTPALGVMTGDKRITKHTDVLKEENKSLTQQLEEAKEQLLKADSPVVLTMPVTKQKVTFVLKDVDPSLIDVSQENERIQSFLDEISLSDILPSIKKQGQQDPGTLRPKPNGRYELIKGSRRLAAVKLAGQQYLALIGDVPDADVRELGVIENKHKDVSPYEKALAYQRFIENGEYENWTQLGASKGISSSHISRYRLCVELDELFVRILPSPSDMPLSYGETISRLKKKSENSLIEKAKELLELRLQALKENLHLPDAEEVIKLLKSAVRTKSEAPKTWKPVLYKSKDGKVLKHSKTNKGATKLEITGANEQDLEKIVSYLTSTLKLKSSS